MWSLSGRNTQRLCRRRTGAAHVASTTRAVVSPPNHTRASHFLLHPTIFVPTPTRKCPYMHAGARSGFLLTGLYTSDSECAEGAQRMRRGCCTAQSRLPHERPRGHGADRAGHFRKITARVLSVWLHQVPLLPRCLGRIPKTRRERSGARASKCPMPITTGACR